MNQNWFSMETQSKRKYSIHSIDRYESKSNDFKQWADEWATKFDRKINQLEKCNGISRVPKKNVDFQFQGKKKKSTKLDKLILYAPKNEYGLDIFSSSNTLVATNHVNR